MIFRSHECETSAVCVCVCQCHTCPCCVDSLTLRLCFRCVPGYSGNPLLGQRCSQDSGAFCRIPFSSVFNAQSDRLVLALLQVTATTVTKEEAKAAPMAARVAAR